MPQSYLVSGQNVRIRQHLAGLAPRMAALVTDFFVIATYLYCILYCIMRLDDIFNISFWLNDWAMFFTIFCPAVFYMPLCETLNNGQSVGKRLMNIRVVRLDGNPLTIGNCIMRFLLLPIDSLLGCGLGTLLIALTPKSQRLGDLASGTTVVSDRAFRTSRVDLRAYDYLLHDYTPAFSRAAELTQKQAGIISHVLASRGKDRDMRLFNLMRKVEPIVGKPTDEHPEADSYLNRVLSDWRYYQMTAD